MVAIGIHAADPMLISKAGCDEWVRGGGGGADVRLKTCHSAWHIVVYKKLDGGGHRGDGGDVRGGRLAR